MKHKLLLSVIIFIMTLSTPLLAGYITIGTGTGSSISPYFTYSLYSTTQSIYTASEMGSAAEILTISHHVYKRGTNSSGTKGNVTIYMGHTPKSFFSSSKDYEDVSNMTLVYSGYPTLAATDGWEEFTLTTPFSYNGSDNLIVVITKQTSGAETKLSWYDSSYTSNCKCLERDDSERMYYSDANNYSNFSTSRSRADVRFGTSDFTKNGIYYMITSGTEARVVRCNADTKEIKIPSKITTDKNTYNVTDIGEHAFSGCTGVTSIELPSGLTTIEKYAFANCSNLTNIELPSNVRIIGEGAFYNSGLTSIKLGSKVTQIEKDVFNFCQSLTSIKLPLSVTKIGKSAFYGCNSLTSIELSSSISNISTSAFTYCDNLAEAKVYIQNWTKESKLHEGLPNSIKWRYYTNNEELKDVIIPDSVTSIGAYCLYKAEGINSIEIPEGITNIGSSAFYGCTGKLIVNCNIGSVSKYDLGWFYGSKFKSIEIGKKVTNIGKYAFFGNDCIQSLVIGSGVTTIEDAAFSKSRTKVFWLTNTLPSGYNTASGEVNYVLNNNFSKLNNIKVYPYLSSMFEDKGIKYIPVNPTELICDAVDYTYLAKDSIISIEKTASYRNVIMTVKNINDYIGQGNNTIKELTVNADCDINQTHFYNSGTLRILKLTNTGNIGHDAFARCNSLQSAEISNNGNIEEFAFLGCSSLLSANINNTGYIGIGAFYECTTLQSIEISNNGNIEENAFWGCSSLLFANINNTGYIGRSAFHDCTQLTSCTIGDEATSIEESAFSGCNSLLYLKLGTQISSIGMAAFSKCSKLIEISIPEATTTLGSHCFEECTSLKKVDTGDGLTTIPSSAFSRCSLLESINIGKGVKTIETYAFQRCKKITSIFIPSNVNKIDSYVFEGCTALADVVFADRKESLFLGLKLFNDCPLSSLYIGGKISFYTSQSAGYSPFYCNTKLRTVVITNEETEIYPKEFYGCTNLRNVKIGDGVAKIGEQAFYNCSNLEYLKFGKELKSIGKDAFSGCGSLEIMYSNAYIPPVCENRALKDINKQNCTLFVPNESIKDYQTADQWKDFFYIVDNTEAPSYYILRYIVDGNIYHQDTIKERGTIKPIEAPTKEGYTFSGWSEIPEFMPSHDVEVTGNFTINTYAIVYMVDGEVYKIDSVQYNNTIHIEEVPTKEGYTFSGWSKIPENMPAHDLTVTGYFAITKYKIELTVSDGGTATVNNENPEHGSSVVLFVAPDEGFDINMVLIGNKDITSDLFLGTYTIPNIASDIKISVTFSAVSDIEEMTKEASLSTMYSVSGRKVQNARQGTIFVQDGKKLIVK